MTIQFSIQSFLAESLYMSALTQFANIVNTVRPPSLRVFFLLRRRQCQRPSVVNVFYSFSFSANVPLILLIAFPTWSQSSKELQKIERELQKIETLPILAVPMAIILYRFILYLTSSCLFIFEMLTPWSSGSRLPLILIEFKFKFKISQY